MFCFVALVAFFASCSNPVKIQEEQGEVETRVEMTYEGQEYVSNEACAKNHSMIVFFDKIHSENVMYIDVFSKNNFCEGIQFVNVLYEGKMFSESALLINDISKNYVSGKLVFSKNKLSFENIPRE
jgi:hypothetical protein